MSFAQRLRRSRFAGFRPSPTPPPTATTRSTTATFLPQVFQKPAGSAAGDFGFKRGVPASVQASQFVAVRDFDTQYNHMRVQDAAVPELRFRLCGQVFSSTPTSTTTGTTTTGTTTDTARAVDLATLTDAQFEQLLHQEVPLRKQEYQRRVGSDVLKSTRDVRMQTVRNVMQLTSAEDIATAYPCSLHYLQGGPRGESKDEVPSEASATADSRNTDSPTQAMPTQTPPTTHLKVKGRVLNRVRSGFAIGVAGTVGYLPFVNYAMHPHFDPDNRGKLVDFYVEAAGWSPQGKPHLILSLTPPIHQDTANGGSGGGTSSGEAERRSREAQLQNLLADILGDDTSSSSGGNGGGSLSLKQQKGTGKHRSGQQVVQGDFMDSLSEFLDAFGTNATGSSEKRTTSGNGGSSGSSKK